MHAIPLLALSFALANPVTGARPIVTAAQAPRAESAQVVSAGHVEAGPVEAGPVEAASVDAAPVEAAPSLSGADVVLAAGAGGVGVALGIPLLFGVTELAPSNFFLGEPLLLLPLVLVLPAPLLAGGVAALSAHLDDLAPSHAAGRVAFTAAGAGGVALVGSVAGGVIGFAQRCSGMFCSLGNLVLGGLGGALVGGVVGSTGGLLLGDALFARPRETGE